MSGSRTIGLIVGVVIFVIGLVVLLSSGGDGDRPTAFVESTPGSQAVIWAAGDGADGGDAADSIAKLIEGDDPQHFLYLGDVYEMGTAEEFDANYQSVYGSLNEITAPTVGNHEAPNEDQGYYPFWGEAKGIEAPRWYSFVAGGWELLGLNSMEPGGTRSPQLEWLREALSAPGFGSCRIAFMHHPRYSAGRYPDDHSLEPISRALSGRATLILAGHDHNMQRFRPIGGLTQLVQGAGGHGHYGVDERDPRLLFADDRRYGALRLDIQGETATATFVSADGTVLDRSRHRCRRGAPTSS